MSYYEASIESPIGQLRLIASDTGLRCLLMPNERPDRVSVPFDRIQAKNHVISVAERQLNEYFAGKRTEFSIPLEIEGTKFEEKVWRGLLTIPYGETSSYGELARKVGSPHGARAVGRANGLNPLSIVVPCHRVIGKNGTLTGFAGGLDTKHFLLQLEKRGQGATRRVATLA